MLATAIDYLARREYSAFELKQKLLLKGFEDFEINALLFELAKKDIQSDERFTQSFIRSRLNQGKGKILITQDLKQKGISEFDLSNYDFFELAQQVKLKKFGEHPPKNNKEKAKQIRFLQSRGFGFDEIRAAVE